MKKNAVIGIGTLIIFIAMILVAAIAAGVILRTAGVLQQRAYAVGTETRQRVLSAIEISNVVARVNQTSHNTNKIEIMVRLMAGSYPIPFETTGFSFFTKDSFLSAKLQSPDLDEWADNPLFNVSGLDHQWKDTGDLDDDGISDQVRIDNGTGDPLFEIKLSRQQSTFFVNLSEYNLTAGNNISILDLKLYNANTQDIWGFIQANGTVSQTDTFKGLNVQITEFPREPEHRNCNFDNLIPERYYCIQVKLGKNADTSLESGEIFVILYKLKSFDALSGDEEYGFKFIPKRGQETELYDRTPDVLSEYTTVLYPR